MDLHLNKINIGAVADRAVRGVGLVGLLALTLGPLPLQQANPATAGSLSWSGISEPIKGGTVTALAVAGTANGDVFAAIGNKVYRSTNGGTEWGSPKSIISQPVAGTERAADPSADPPVTEAPAKTATCMVMDLRISPNYDQDGSIAALCGADKPADSGTTTVTDSFLAVSIDNGNTWKPSTFLGEDTSPADELAVSFDIAPNFDGNDGGDILVGLDGGVAYARWGDSNAFIDADGPTVDGNGTGTSSFVVEDAANRNVLAISFSPRYTSSNIAVRIVHTNGTVVEDRARIGRGSNTLAPTGTWTNSANANTVIETVAAGDNESAILVWPSDVESSAENYWVGLSVGPAPVTGGVYRNSGSFQKLTDLEATSVTGLVARGTFGSASLYAADNLAQSHRSTNGGDSWRQSEDIDGDQEFGNISGATTLAMDGSGNLYAVSSGDSGGVHRSVNSASSWSDTGLTNEDYSAKILHLESTSSSTLLGVFDSDSGTSVFRVDNQGSGGDWVRVDRTDKLIQVACSPNVAADGGCYLLRDNSTGEQILRSTNGGNNFEKTDSDPSDNASIDSIAVVSSSTVFAGSSDGYVIRTSDGGFGWDKSSTDMGNSVVDITVSSEFATDNTLLAAAKGTDGSFEAWMSSDGGATFTKVGTSVGAWGGGAGSWAQVEFSPLYPTDMNVYFVASVSADKDIFRKDLSATKNWDEAGGGASASPGDPFSQIFLFEAAGSPDGYALYAADADGGKFARTYKPITTRATSDWLAADGNGSAEFGRYGSNAYRAGTWWMINTAGDADVIDTWSDSSPFNNGVTLTSPLPGGSVPSNTGENAQPVAFNWQQVRSDTDRYKLEIALDPSFVSLIESSVVEVPFSLLPVSRLGDGATYWWRVRVEGADRKVGDGDTPIPDADVDPANNIAANPGPWSAAQSFSVGSTGAPTAPTPSLPLNNAQLPGLSTNLSWNNPSGTTQVHVQVTPLNGDGPGIDLIYGSSISSYNVPAPSFGVGPYVMLPGATYTWRVRTTRATTSIGSDDSSWGPFSDPRTFTTAAPNAGTIQELAPINGDATSDTTPTLQWKDANAAMFYYEIQLSSDPNFGEAGAVAPVYWNLIHAGVSTPPSSWTVPDSAALAAGSYYWRARQRVQATPLGSAETGIAWTPAQMFVVQ